MTIREQAVEGATAMSKRTDLQQCIELARITEQYFFEYVRDCAKIADPSVSNIPEDVSYATQDNLYYKREMFLTKQSQLRYLSNAYYDDHGITKDHAEIERVIRITI
jgi:hypothetical protein